MEDTDKGADKPESKCISELLTCPHAQGQVSPAGVFPQRWETSLLRSPCNYALPHPGSAPVGRQNGKGDPGGSILRGWSEMT